MIMSIKKERLCVSLLFRTTIMDCSLLYLMINLVVLVKLLFTKKIEADHIAYISLSSYEPYETIPPYYKYLDYQN